ncbi:MAG TPA: DUF3800 domain-containing protein [Alphaproteobacteria bacterium]
MKVCYIDEAGDLGALADPPQPNDQPVLVIGGLFLDTDSIEAVTNEFLGLKQLFFPGLPYRSPTHLDRILPEIKGAEVRSNATRGSAAQRHHAIGFLDRVVGLLRRHEAKLVARIWIKGVGLPFEPTPVYTSSIQGICSYFDHYLGQSQAAGFCIADSRNKFKNVNVSHSIFTQKYSPVSRNYRQILELPTFAHSDNHAGLQICDLVCSALLYPIACYAYCTGHVVNVHVQPGAAALKQRYGQAIRDLQYRYLDADTGRYRGGLVVADAIAQRNASLMFR